jgi:hypothetical protein
LSCTADIWDAFAVLGSGLVTNGTPVTLVSIVVGVLFWDAWPMTMIEHRIKKKEHPIIMGDAATISSTCRIGIIVWYL